MFKVLNKFGCDEGEREKPVKLAPIEANHSESQLPLKPVCPVKRTDLFFQKIGSIAIFSMVLNFLSKDCQDKACLLGCPSAAKIHHAHKKPALHLRLTFAEDLFLRSSYHPQGNQKLQGKIQKNHR